MLNNSIFRSISEQIEEVFKNNPFIDVEKNFKEAIITIFNKLELVTRQEFDIQEKVLIKLREKLDVLENKLLDLESKKK